MNNTVAEHPKTNTRHAEANDKSRLAVDVSTPLKMTNSEVMSILGSLYTDLNKGEASRTEISLSLHSYDEQVSEKVLKISQEIAKKITNSRIKSKPKTKFQPYVFKRNPVVRNVVTIRVSPPTTNKLSSAVDRSEDTSVKEKQFEKYANFIHTGKKRLIPFEKMLGTAVAESSSSSCITSQESKFSVITTCSVNGKSYIIQNANKSLTYDSKKTHGANSELQTNTTEFGFTSKLVASCKSQTTAVQTTYDPTTSELLTVPKIKKNRRAVNKSKAAVTRQSRKSQQRRKPRRKNISRYHKNKLKQSGVDSKFQKKAVGVFGNPYIRYKEMNVPAMPKPADSISELYVNESSYFNQEYTISDSVISDNESMRIQYNENDIEHMENFEISVNSHDSESNPTSTSTMSTADVCFNNAALEGNTCASQQIQFEGQSVDQVKLIAGLLEPFIPAYKRRRPYPVAMWKAIQHTSDPI